MILTSYSASVIAGDSQHTAALQNDIILAEYSRIRFILPFFLILVFGSVGYDIVGSLFCDNRDASAFDPIDSGRTGIGYCKPIENQADLILFACIHCNLAVGKFPAEPVRSRCRNCHDTLVHRGSRSCHCDGISISDYHGFRTAGAPIFFCHYGTGGLTFVLALAACHNYSSCHRQKQTVS